MDVVMLALAGSAGLGYWFLRIKRDTADEACVLRAISNLGSRSRISEIHERFLRTSPRALSIIAVGVHVVELQHRGLVVREYGVPLWQNGPRPELFSRKDESPA